ncbi:hypothetical protein CBL_04277 [Carabus blaptoides fortunei]
MDWRRIGLVMRSVEPGHISRSLEWIIRRALCRGVRTVTRKHCPRTKGRIVPERMADTKAEKIQMGFVTGASSVGAHAAIDMDRCEDTSSLLQGYGLTATDKTTRTTSSPNQGPRHTIDHILGLARNNRDEGVTECRSETPGTGAESAVNLVLTVHRSRDVEFLNCVILVTRFTLGCSTMRQIHLPIPLAKSSMRIVDDSSVMPVPMNSVQLNTSLMKWKIHPSIIENSQNKHRPLLLLP